MALPQDNAQSQVQNTQAPAQGQPQSQTDPAMQAPPAQDAPIQDSAPIQDTPPIQDTTMNTDAPVEGAAGGSEAGYAMLNMLPDFQTFSDMLDNPENYSPEQLKAGLGSLLSGETLQDKIAKVNSYIEGGSTNAQGDITTTPIQPNPDELGAQAGMDAQQDMGAAQTPPAQDETKPAQDFDAIQNIANEEGDNAQSQPQPTSQPQPQK